jgi:hypothetical protein
MSQDSNALEQQLERLAREWETIGRQINATLFALGLFSNARPLYLSEKDEEFLRELDSAFPTKDRGPE